MGLVTGGFSTYGEVAGIIVLESPVPRIPGDPGHAATFGFPVRYGIPAGFPFMDLVRGDRARLESVIQTAWALQESGVRFVACDCGLFSIFHEEISTALSVPFLSSSLMLIPLLQRTLPPGQLVGVITGHSGFLTQQHLAPVGADLASVAVEGMQNDPEFCRVVIERAQQLDPERMRADTLAAGHRLIERNPDVSAIVLECTNLITFRSDLQKALRRPVFDMLSLVDLMAAGFRHRTFQTEFL